LDGGGVGLEFLSGRTETFDLVVAADGINSAAVPAVDTSAVESAKSYTGLRIQYGVCEAGARPEGAEEEAHQWFGEEVYALTATYGGCAGRRYEMIAVVFREDAEARENVGWERDTTLAVQQACIGRLKKGGLGAEVLRVAEKCDRFFELGVFARPVLKPWSRGCLVLVGDAAHAMPPFLGQGANQAIQDAVCLARWLGTARKLGGGQPGAVELALRGYELQRQLPVGVLSLESAFLGQVETLPGQLGSFVRNNFFKFTAASGLAELVFLNGAIVRA